MLGYLGYLGAGSVGPKQQKCLAAGGSWEGPMGRKKCVGGTAGAPTGATGGALPKPGSTVTGPIPPEYVGTATAPKGAVGPKQAACVKQGGVWIGPVGKRWCQMPVGTIPAPVAVSKDTGLVSTAVVPPGAEVVSTGGSLPSVGGGQMDVTPETYMQPGLQTEATGAPGGAVYETPSGMFSGRNLAILAAAGIAGFFLWKKLRKRKH